jgi:DNA-binding beta-propeller fold protein YncE
MMKGICLAVLSVFTFAAGPLSAAEEAAGGFKIVQKAPLPADGGWDFLTSDPVGRRLYVTHADSVQVLDSDTLKLLGTVSPVSRPHGVVVLPELGRGYVTSGDPGSVVVFDLQSLTRVAEVTCSKDADVIIYEPVTGHIFTFNGDSGNSTVIDPGTLKVVGTMDLGGSPEVAVADGKGIIYDNLSDKNQILKIDAQTLKVLDRWSIAPGANATGLALDAANGRLFAGCRNKMTVVVDVATGKVVQTLPIGEHVDSTGFDSKNGLIFNSCGDGTLSVIHEDSPDKYSVVENAKTEAGARTLAFDSKTGHVFTDTADFGPEPKDGPEKEKKHRKPLPGSFRVLELAQ